MFNVRFGMTLIAIMLMGMAFAQEKNTATKERKSEDPPEKVKVKGTLPANFKKLGLTDEQVQKVYKIRADYRQRSEGLRRQLEQLKGEEREAMEKVLTTEQVKRLRDLRVGDKDK